MGIFSKVLGKSSTEDKVKQCAKEASELNSKANVLVEMERYDEAIILYDRSADMWEKIGDFFSKRNFDDRAQDAHRRLYEAMSGKGLVYFRLGSYEDALRCIDPFLDIYPDNIRNWSNRGMALFYLGRYEEAMESFDRALGIDPEFTEALCSKGSCLAHLGRYGESLDLFNKAKDHADIAYFNFPRFTWISLTGSSTLKPDVSQACYFKGVVLSMLGRYKEAVDSFDEAIEARPNFPEATDAKTEALSKI
ncbi:tetratricopeptide repeat protein [Methanolobus psychrotolerans]|uniref:tetratricopeptide repeat protein n=1 Tax=Methanolobus psychrotolerans TaxID=1874706 RepID=UPI0013EBBD54|nr:tetratricopeptide repeat protein [Methanolobus psychrotolerans]